MGLFGGKNSFFNKPLGKNSDLSRVATAVLAPARATVDATQDIAKGDLNSAKNRIIGTVGYVSSGGQFINASSSLKKALSKTGFTDQFVQMNEINQKQMSGKTANWKDIRGYAGGMLENAAYAAALYGGYAAYGAATAPASTTPAFGSKAGYLGFESGFGSGTSAGLTSSSQFGLSGSSLLSGSSATAGSTGYLGANTAFGASSAAGASSGAFMSAAKSFASDTLKTVGSAYVTAAALSGGQRPQPGQEGYVSALPYYGSSPGQTIIGGSENLSSSLAQIMPLIFVGGAIFFGSKLLQRA